MAGRSAGIAIGVGIAVIAIGFIVAYNSGSLGSLSVVQSETSDSTDNISEEGTKTVSGVEIKSFTTTPDAPTDLKILDNEVFVLGPQATKTYEFTLDNPSYPIKVSGDMTVADHSEQVKFVIKVKDSPYNNVAPMTTSPDNGKAAIGRSVAGSTPTNYVEIYDYYIPLKDRENPTFRAVFENLGDKEQTVTANLQFMYG